MVQIWQYRQISIPFSACIQTDPGQILLEALERSSCYGYHISWNLCFLFCCKDVSREIPPGSTVACPYQFLLLHQSNCRQFLLSRYSSLTLLFQASVSRNYQAGLSTTYTESACVRPLRVVKPLYRSMPNRSGKVWHVISGR